MSPNTIAFVSWTSSVDPARSTPVPKSLVVSDNVIEFAPAATDRLPVIETVEPDCCVTAPPAVNARSVLSKVVFSNSNAPPESSVTVPAPLSIICPELVSTSNTPAATMLVPPRMLISPPPATSESLVRVIFPKVVVERFASTSTSPAAETVRLLFVTETTPVRLAFPAEDVTTKSPASIVAASTVRLFEASRVAPPVPISSRTDAPESTVSVPAELTVLPFSTITP